MRNYLALLIALFSITSVMAQQDFVPKSDGTKYYLEIYDGATNKKVLQFEDRPGWQYKIFTGGFFDGSNKQLWSFEATAMFPGYFSIVNQQLTNSYHLMSYSWYAYFSNASNRDPKTDKEMQFKFEKVTDDYYKLITIEKPTDGSLYGINYTPGADALNVDEKGQADFGGVKGADITPANMVNMVFKIVEFNPIALFAESIDRGQKLYNDNPNASAKARLDLFYVLEKARAIRVFGKESEMLDFQDEVDAAVGQFTFFIQTVVFVAEAKTFIAASTADADVKTAFNAVIAKVESAANDENLDYVALEVLKANLNEGQKLVTEIVNSQTYYSSLQSHTDSRLAASMLFTINGAKAVLANSDSGSADFTKSVAVLTKTKGLIGEVVSAEELIAKTQGFGDDKKVLEAAITKALAVINTTGVSTANLDTALADIKAAVKVFKKALEAGDTGVNLINPGFENSFDHWYSESDNPGIPYTQSSGVGGSKNMAVWNGSDYHVATMQSLDGIPNGKYQISAMVVVSQSDAISLFAESGTNTVASSLAFDAWTYTKRTIEINVVDGTLKFGIKGNGTGNLIPANIWGTFDDFEVKWLSASVLANPGFENSFNGWTSVSDDAGIPYIQNSGVDGSKNMAVWKGSDYHVMTSQTLSNIQNGTYKVSMMAKVSAADAISFFAESGANSVVKALPNDGSTYTKRSIDIVVTDGTLKFGVKGSGTDNLIPANIWGIFDNFEVVRLPSIGINNFDFESGLTGWSTIPVGTWYPYIEQKGVEKSKSVTFWNSVDYGVSTYQSISGVSNGLYEVSAMTLASNDNSFVIYGKSKGVETKSSILAGGALAKSNVVVEVTDGAVEFGIKGSGADALAPAGHWIVFDNFAMNIKSITPNYVNQLPKSESIGDSQELEKTNGTIFWQEAQLLCVNSSDVIVKYEVYNLTGSLVENGVPQTNQLRIPLSQGVYLVTVTTKDGSVSVKKIAIR